MFYYVIYNSTVLNYSNNNKKLNTFIYGTVLYILSHGLINSYDNTFAKYIKSYFWIVLAIDIFAMYYLYNYIDNNSEKENETESLKSLLTTFYNSSGLKKNNPEKSALDKEEKIDEESVDEEINKENKNIETLKDFTASDDSNLSEPMAYFQNDQYSSSADDQNDISDQLSDAGSDIDLDKFEQTLN
jgi:hypothetical protein